MTFCLCLTPPIAATVPVLLSGLWRRPLLFSHLDGMPLSPLRPSSRAPAPPHAFSVLFFRGIFLHFPLQLTPHCLLSGSYSFSRRKMYKVCVQSCPQGRRSRVQNQGHRRSWLSPFVTIAKPPPAPAPIITSWLPDPKLGKNAHPGSYPTAP